MPKYVNWHEYKRGVKREDGTGRLCMHCTLPATFTADRKDSKFTMQVWVCRNHAKTLKGVR